MSRLTNPLVLIGLALLLLLASSMVFTVDERERAIKLFLGEITESEKRAGSTVCLPMHPFITSDDIALIAGEVRNFLT